MGGVTLNLRPVMERKARQVTVELQPPLHADLHLPTMVVRVPLAVAEELRDTLCAVLPVERDLMHDPAVRDVDVLRAARGLLAERGQDTESIAITIESYERNVDPPPHIRLHDSVCPWCEGAGRVPGDFVDDGSAREWQRCFDCNGTGKRREQS